MPNGQSVLDLPSDLTPSLTDYVHTFDDSAQDFKVTLQKLHDLIAATLIADGLDGDQLLTSAEQTLTDIETAQVLTNIALSSLANGYFGTATVADRTARLALDKTLNRIIQDDNPGVLWFLVAEDTSLDASWIGVPYTVDPSGAIVVSMELSDVTGIIPSANVLGHVGGVLSVGDGSTTAGKLIPAPLLLDADPVLVEFVTITGTLTSDGSTSIATPVNLPSTGGDNYTDSATLVLAYSEPSDQWSLNDGVVAEWLSGVGEGFAAATWTPQGTETGTPVAVLTEATAGTPGQLAIIPDGGVWIYDALGVWQELF